MSTELDTITPKMQQVSPEYAEILMLGNVLQKSGYFSDLRDQAQAVTKILFGRELGFSPIVSITGIHVIEGKPALSSNLMATLIKRSGKYDYRVKEWDADHCVLMFREKVGGQWEEVGLASFSIEDAKTAGIQFTTKNGYATSWKKFPKAMLFARALSQGLRTYCPDVSASPLYVPEEMGAEVNEEGDVVQLPKSARPVERTTEEIILEKPRSAAEHRAQDGQKGMAGTVHAAETHSTATVSPTVEANGGDNAGNGNTPAAVEYISVKEQKEFHAACRGCFAPDARTNADQLIYQWLIDHGFVNEKGEPSTKVIPANKWPAAKIQAVAWLKANQ